MSTPAPPLKRAIIICGPTACGKDALSHELGRRHNLPVIMMDSMKVYRRMDIGTDKPTAEERSAVTYHQVDIRDPSQTYSVSEYLAEVDELLLHYNAKGITPLISGGTFLYLRALLYGLNDGLPSDDGVRAQLHDDIDTHGLETLHKRLSDIDPKAGQRLHPNDKKRIVRALEVYTLTGIPMSDQQTQMAQQRDDFSPLILPMWWERERLYERINARVGTMVQSGLIDEVKAIRNTCGFSSTALAGVGYAQVTDHLDGKLDYGEMLAKIKQKTRHLAKHQITWMRNMEGLPTPLEPSDADTAHTIADGWDSGIRTFLQDGQQ